MPDTTLENRISSQWGEIGFQGKNPETDFRGMGMSVFSACFYTFQTSNFFLLLTIRIEVFKIQNFFVNFILFRNSGIRESFVSNA